MASGTPRAPRHEVVRERLRYHGFTLDYQEGGVEHWCLGEDRAVVLSFDIDESSASYASSLDIVEATLVPFDHADWLCTTGQILP